MRKFWKGIALVFFLCWMSSIAVFATQGKIDKVQEGIEGLEKQNPEPQTTLGLVADVC